MIRAPRPYERFNVHREPGRAGWASTRSKDQVISPRCKWRTETEVSFHQRSRLHRRVLPADAPKSLDTPANCLHHQPANPPRTAHIMRAGADDNGRRPLPRIERLHPGEFEHRRFSNRAQDVTCSLNRLRLFYLKCCISR